MKGFVILNMKETRTNDIIIKYLNKKINMKQVIKLSSLSERQMYRKIKAYKDCGISSIPHKSRGVSLNSGYSFELKNEIINLYLSEYNGWNFYHFNDFLLKIHNINVSNTFIYNLMSYNNIKSPYAYKKRKKSHPPRERKEFAGELIQMDACKHAWLFGDNNYYHLHGAIDDATGNIVALEFLKEETILGYQLILKKVIENYGIPSCLYTDYRTIFKSPKSSLTIEEELAGKVLKTPKYVEMITKLGIDIIPTLNPMAKGKIERLWRTLQSRLYNEMKKLDINTLEKANHYLIEFTQNYNNQFAFHIDDTKNMFIRPDEDFDYNLNLAIAYEKSIARHCYIKHKNDYLIIMNGEEEAYFDNRKKVQLLLLLDQTYVVKINDCIYKTRKVLVLPNFKEVLEEKPKIPKQNQKTNSPWRNGLPKMPSTKNSQYAFLNAS